MGHLVSQGLDEEDGVREDDVLGPLGGVQVVLRGVGRLLLLRRYQVSQLWPTHIAV
jgi:hypothetical protein